MDSNTLICIAGKNNIAVDVLQKLYSKYKDKFLFCVICDQCDKGINTWQKSLRYFAKRLNVPEYKLEDVYQVENMIFLSLEFDKIIKPERFQSKRLYNIHFSKLPAYKGCHTSVIPILNGENEIGVTFHEIDKGIDTGNIVRQKTILMSEDDTALDVYTKFLQNGTELVLECFENLLNGDYSTRQQGWKNASYYSAKYIDYSNIQINLNQTASQVKKQVQAYNFRPYQLPKINEKPIVRAEITDEKSMKKAGSILELNENKMRVATIDYDIILYVDRLAELFDACETGDLDEVKEICDSCKLVNDKNENGWTALMVATYYNQKDIVKYLISSGADIEKCNNNGTNLLMYAKDAYLKTGDSELLMLYMELGISPDFKDYRGKNLWDYINRDNTITEEKRKNIYNLLN